MERGPFTSYGADKFLTYMALGRELAEMDRRRDAMPVDSIDDTRAKDLDETRRLCYMALVYQRADGRHELVGTLVNALVHHQRVNEPVDVVIDQVIAAIVLSDTDALGWVQSQIDRINEELA